MRIDKNSYGTVFGVLAVCMGLVFVLLKYVHCLWISLPLTAILIWFSIFVCYFFRVPRRCHTGSDKTVTSVADGEVVIIEKAYEGEYLKRDCIQVSVYMNFFDMHANFWPVSGKVCYYKYHPGEHFLAFKPKASEENEHTCTAIRTADGQEVFFKQLAGTFARRIVNYAEDGLKVVSGDQCGIIKFGSRIDMYLPLDADIKVKKGDITRACETVIAQLQ